MGLRDLLRGGGFTPKKQEPESEIGVTVTVETVIDGQRRILEVPRDLPEGESGAEDFEMTSEAVRKAFEKAEALDAQAAAIVSAEDQERAIGLVRNPELRDLDQAEEILDPLWNGTEHYIPCFCSYVEIFYKRGDYERCAELALELHERALNEPVEFGAPPPAPIRLAAKAFRALGRDAKKRGDTAAAAQQFCKIVEIGEATDNDMKVLAKLRAEAESA